MTKLLSRKEAEDLADMAGNEAIAEIQIALGVEHGDFAGIYFSGEKWQELVKILADYIEAETIYRQHIGEATL